MWLNFDCNKGGAVDECREGDEKRMGDIINWRVGWEHGGGRM